MLRQSSGRRKNSSIWSFLVLPGLALERAADIDAEGSGELSGAITNGAGNAAIFGDGGEQLPGLGGLALLGKRQGGHLAGATEPGLAGLGERLKPRDQILRLKLVEFE